MSFVQYLTGLEATKIVVDTTGKVRSVLGDTAEIANNIQDNFFGAVNNAELGLYNVALTVQENVANIAYDAEIRGLNIAADLVERGTMLVYDIIEIVSYLVLLGAVLTIVVILLFHSEIFKLSGLLVTTLGGLSGKYLGLSGSGAGVSQNTDPQKIEDARKKASKAVEAFMPVKIENLKQRDIAEKQMKYAVDSAITSSFGSASGGILGNLKTAIVGTDTSPKIIEKVSSEEAKEELKDLINKESEISKTEEFEDLGGREPKTKSIEALENKSMPAMPALEVDKSLIELPENLQAVPYMPRVGQIGYDEFNIVPEGYKEETSRPTIEEIYEPVPIKEQPMKPIELPKISPEDYIKEAAKGYPESPEQTDNEVITKVIDTVIDPVNHEEIVTEKITKTEEPKIETIPYDAKLSDISSSAESSEAVKYYNRKVPSTESYSSKNFDIYTRNIGKYLRSLSKSGLTDDELYKKIEGIHKQVYPLASITNSDNLKKSLNAVYSLKKTSDQLMKAADRLTLNGKNTEAKLMYAYGHKLKDRADKIEYDRLKSGPVAGLQEPILEILPDIL